MKSKNWIVNLDDQLRAFKPQGLRLFEPTWGEGNFIDWRTYPWAALPMDFGSDGVCAGHALMHKQDWKLNVDVVGDPLHLDHPAVPGTLRGGNLYGLAHLWLCRWWLHHLHHLLKLMKRYHQSRAKLLRSAMQLERDHWSRAKLLS